MWNLLKKPSIFVLAVAGWLALFGCSKSFISVLDSEETNNATDDQFGIAEIQPRDDFRLLLKLTGTEDAQIVEVVVADVEASPVACEQPVVSVEVESTEVLVKAYSSELHVCLHKTLASSGLRVSSVDNPVRIKAADYWQEDQLQSVFEEESSAVDESDDEEDDEPTVVPDTTAPVPGGGGILSSSNITTSSIDLDWTLATDDESTAADLEYKVYQSNLNNMGTLFDAELNGTVLQDYTANISTVASPGLDSKTTYYFAVAVRDAAGNTAFYPSVSFRTLNILPTVVISAPASSERYFYSSGDVGITWSTTDPDDVATVSLYLKNNTSGACTTGTLLAGGLAESVTSYDLDVSALTSARYHICIAADDGENTPTSVHSAAIDVYRNCVWNGSVDTLWSNTGNWTACNSMVPQSVDNAAIPSAPANQPTVQNANADIYAIDNGTGGGTITVYSGRSITAHFVRLDAHFVGQSATCSNCNVSGFTILDGAAVTIESGISAGLIGVGDGISGGRLSIDEGADPSAEWPYVSRIEAGGVSGSVSELNINGVRMGPSHANYTGIGIGGYTDIMRLDNISFNLSGILHRSMISLSGCPNITISDTTWSNIDLGPIVLVAGKSYNINFPADCPVGVTVDNMTGDHGAWSYFANDPGGHLTWSLAVNSTQQNCLWKTSPADSNFHSAANWDNCGARSGVPDSIDSVEVPAGASPMPVITQNAVIGKFSGGSGGGQLTVSAGFALFFSDENDAIANDITLQGDSPTCVTCMVWFYRSGVVNNDATLALNPGISLRQTHYWNGFRVGDGSSAGHLVANGGSNSDEYPWLRFRSVTVTGTSSANSSIQIDGLKHSNSSNNDVILLSNYYEVKQFDRFTTTHAHNFPGMVIIELRNCNNGVFTDPMWTDHNYTGTGGENSSNIYATSSCSGASGPLFSVSGSGPMFGEEFELDDYDLVDWL